MHVQPKWRDGCLKGMMSKTIYRKCSCGETAHDMRAQDERDGEGKLVCWAYTWACRNCGSPAKQRGGAVKVRRVPATY